MMERWAGCGRVVEESLCIMYGWNVERNRWGTDGVAVVEKKLETNGSMLTGWRFCGGKQRETERGVREKMCVHNCGRGRQELEKIEEENWLDRPGRTGREQENDNNKAVTYFYGPRRAQLGATLTCLSRVRGQDDGWTDSGGFFSGFRPPVSLVVAAVGGKAIDCTENGWVPGLSVWSGLTGAETRLINK